MGRLESRRVFHVANRPHAARDDVLVHPDDAANKLVDRLHDIARFRETLAKLGEQISVFLQVPQHVRESRDVTRCVVHRPGPFRNPLDEGSDPWQHHRNPQDQRFVDKLIFWVDDKEDGGTVVDAKKEQKRIQRTQALGQPITEGETPEVTIKRGRKGLLDF